MRKLLPIFLVVSCWLLVVGSPVEADVISDFGNWLAPENPATLENSGPYQRLLPKTYQDSHPITETLSTNERARKASLEIHSALNPKEPDQAIGEEWETEGLNPLDLLKKLISLIFGCSADERELGFIPSMAKPKAASLTKYCPGTTSSFFYDLPPYCANEPAMAETGEAKTEGIEDFIPFLGTIKIAKNYMLDSLTPRGLQKE